MIMNLHEQVTSPELSNKLHQLGVTAPSVFWRDWTGAKPEELEWAKNFEPFYCEDNVNAYSVAELGEMLSSGMGDTHKSASGRWICKFVPVSKDGIDRWVEQDGQTEADARAQMLIYLLENGLMTVSNISRR